MNNEPLYRRPPEIEPTIGGFVILYIKREMGLRYEDFTFFGFGSNTVAQWVTGKARPRYDDVLMICEYYNKDIGTAHAIAKILRERYRSEKHAAKTT